MKTIIYAIIAFVIGVNLFGCGSGPQGLPGGEGPQGEQGVAGATGQSCAVSQTTVGALIQCPDGSSAVVLHGQNGHNGKDAKCKHK
jgi:hypothetical protein